MRDEIECCKEHADNGEYDHIVMHMTNLALGCKVTAEMICEQLLSHEQVMELLKTKLEEKFGMPFEYVSTAGGWEQFRMLPIDVPDDASGLDNE